jgi:hypothetical protein
MEIKIQRNGYVLSITIGHRTQWFWQIYFIGVAKEYYNDNLQVEYATLIYHSPIGEAS